jgi:hypothetical protein
MQLNDTWNDVDYLQVQEQALFTEAGQPRFCISPSSLV